MILRRSRKCAKKSRNRNWRSDVMRMKTERLLLSTLTVLLSTLLCSCANHHFRAANGAPPAGAPRYVELLREKQVATLHFPRGIYSFYAIDDKGFYYRAPRPVIQHTGAGSVPHDGGIFVDRTNLKKLRGYIFYAGALTHVGNLSRVPHQFR